MTRRFNRTFLVLLIATTLIAISVQISEDVSGEEETANDNGDISKDLSLENFYHKRYNRLKRATNKPGFFRTLFSVVFEQWNDTRQTVNKINTLVNDNFLPENALPVVETTTSGDANATTTKAPYKITRSEFNKIVQRNLRGLARLYNIELRDALKQSEQNWPEYKRNASIEVSKFL